MLKSGRTWRGVVTALCVVGVLSPAAVGAAQDPERELQGVERRIDRAQQDLRGVERQKAVELADLQRIDARRAELDRELASLNTQLSEAEAQLAESQAALAATTQELVATQAKLDRTRKELARTQRLFAARARSTYMYGGQATWAGLVTGVDTVETFGRGMKYARSVLRHNQAQVERIAALEANVQRATADLAQLQKERAAREAADAERRDAAAEILAQREAVARQVDAEAEKRRLLVARLESDRRSYVAMVNELEAEGQRLEEELARIAAEERARRLAAEREAAERAAEAARQRRLAAIENRRAERAAAPAGPTSEPAPAPAPAPSGALQWPANGPKTSDFGWRTHPIFGTRRFHAGIDIGVGYGAPIVAAAGGVVLSADERGGYGNTVVIDHGGGLATLYAHQSSMSVVAGQSVSRGQVIGAVGSTGYSTGPHLHFEVRQDGVARDPMQYF